MVNENNVVDGSRNRRYGVLISYLYTVTQVIVNLVYVPLLLSNIGDSEYGLYQIVGSIMSYMVTLSTMFSTGLSKQYCVARAKSDTDAMENILFAGRALFTAGSVVAAMACLFVIPAFRAIYSQSLTPSQLDESVLMFILLVCNLIVSMHNTISVTVISANENFVFLKSLQLLFMVLQPISIIIMMRWYPYAVTIVAVQFFLNLISASIQGAYSKFKLNAIVRKHGGCTKIIKQILVFSGSVMLVMIADQLFWRTNQLVLAFYGGAASVAAYAVAIQITNAYMPIGTAISSVFMPKIALLHAERQHERLSELFTKIGKIAFYPLFLVLTGFFLYGKSFVDLWAGDAMSDAYAIAAILMIPLTVDLMQNIGLTILQVMDKYYFRGCVYLALAIANALIVYFIAPHYGGFGAAVCSSVLMFIGNVLIMNIYYHFVAKIDIKSYWQGVLRIAAPLMLLFAVTAIGNRFFMITVDSFIELLICAILYSAAYCFIAYRFSLSHVERKRLHEFIQAKIR